MSGANTHNPIHDNIPNLTDYEIATTLALVEKQQDSDLLIQVLGLDGVRVIAGRKPEKEQAA